MADAKLAELIARSLLDLEFRAQLLKDPAGALAANGVEATPERLAELAKLDAAELDRMGKLLERRFLGSRGKE
ncbi:MAG: hypothetical protein KC583_01875 [Myxococcales bacterium]|nr:hypothetical protein [Myxococcales bacterium]